MNNFILLILILFSPPGKIQTLKYNTYSRLHNISDPSGICQVGSNFYIANDKGGLFEVNSSGKILNKRLMGWDNEDICWANGKLYMMDESGRRVFVIDTGTLKITAEHQLYYAGPRNLGFESLAYLADKHQFVAISEKQPSLLVVLDENFNTVNQFPVPGVDDISGATYHNHALWILSDEDHVIWKVDEDKLTADDFTVEKKWNIPIYNPEGICFDNDGTMRIVSDQCRRMYVFPNPEQQ